MIAGLPVGEIVRHLLSRRTVYVAAALAAGCVWLAGCGDGGGDSTAAAANPPPPNPPANQAPTISGTPPTTVMQGQAYSFTPTASDANGDTLTFSVTNKPSWATFAASNGQLSGTPGPGDVRTYSNIQISVSDGTATATLGAFGIQVVATATGSAMLSWTPPTTNTDGSALTDLAGYKIYWGPSAGNYTNSVTLNNPGLSEYVVSQLTAGTWYFAASAINSGSVESVLSNAVSKTIN
jgi:hypothetical protein